MSVKPLQQVDSTLAYLRKRSRNSYLTSLISIALLLYFLSLCLALGIFTNTFVKHAINTFEMKVFLNDGYSEAERLGLQARLKAETYVRELSFTSKEEAGEILMERTGEDFMSLLGGVNPLFASFNIQIAQPYIQKDSLAMIKARLSEESWVTEVDYPAALISQVNRNVTLISVILLVLGSVMLLIVFYLIIATIRLAIFAQRLTIRSMQLIGATRGFIRRPFVRRGVLQGGGAGVIAAIFLALTLYAMSARIASSGISIDLFRETHSIGLFVGIVLFGILIGALGSYFAVNKFLNRNLDELL